MLDRRVVVTGIGIVSPLGNGADIHFRRLLAGESAVEPWNTNGYQSYPGMLKAAIAGFDRKVITNRMLRKLLSPSAAYALAGAVGALGDAGIGNDAGALRTCGVYVGSVCLDVNPEAFIPALRESIAPDNRVDLARFATHGMNLVDPLFLVKSLPNAGACAIAIELQTLGPNLNITNGAVSGLQAVIAGAAAVRSGRADVVVAGGYDTLIQMDSAVEHLLSGYVTHSIADPKRSCRPFAPDADGYALGEGAAFLVLEAEGHAQDRGARIYAEIASWAQDAYAPNLLGPADDRADWSRVARQTIRDAGCSPEDIGMVFGDGLGVPCSDRRELAMAGQTFGTRGVLYSSATPAVGFTGAASGAFSLAHACFSIDRQIAPPLLNYPSECEGPFCFASHARPAGIDHALVWNSDHGIKTAAILARQYPSQA
jgi:3-oxoacyl-[acyl-carrier-protein] synthase II